jgi:hypothetical protein
LDDRALADRLVNYADALAAVAFVGMSGLSISLAEPEVRCSITQGAFVPVVAANVLSTGIVSLLLVVLRSWEMDLRSSDPPSAKAARYMGRIYVARFIIVWFSGAAAILSVVAAARDTACAI